MYQVLADADSYVQTLNDNFTNPSGEDLASVQLQPAPETTAEAVEPMAAAETVKVNGN